LQATETFVFQKKESTGNWNRNEHFTMLSLNALSLSRPLKKSGSYDFPQQTDVIAALPTIITPLEKEEQDNKTERFEISKIMI